VNGYQILNPQQVAVSLDYSIKYIKGETTTGFNLLDMEVGLELTDSDIRYNLGIMDTIGLGIHVETGEEIDLFDTSGKIFFQIYIKQIRDYFKRPDTMGTLGFGFSEMPTTVLSAGLLETTLAHELCHNVSLEHENDPNYLMFPYGPSRVGSDLTLAQVMQIKQYLKEYPKKFVRPEGY
jgi:hypothetical protein